MCRTRANVGARQYLGNINVLHAIRRSFRLDETARSPILLLDRKEARTTEGKITRWKLEMLRKFSCKCVEKCFYIVFKFIVRLFRFILVLIIYIYKFSQKRC